jgi:hypothetical protein
MVSSVQTTAVAAAHRLAPGRGHGHTTSTGRTRDEFSTRAPSNGQEVVVSASGSGPHASVEALVVDVRRIGTPDLDVVDALARLVLDAHRAGRAVVFEGASPELRALLDLAGLSDALERDRRRLRRTI